MSASTSEFDRVVLRDVPAKPDGSTATLDVTVYRGLVKARIRRKQQQLVVGPAQEIRQLWRTSMDALLQDRNRRARRASRRVGVRFADVRPRPEPTGYVEQFVSSRERSGRVRDIDRERGFFVAILSAPGGGEQDQVVGHFPLALLDHADRDRIQIGTGFTMVTARHELVSPTGRIAKPSLRTSLVLHRPRPLSPEREARARQRGRDARARL